MRRIRLLFLLSCLSTLCTCREGIRPLPTVQPLALSGRYKLLTLTEEPYTDNSINDLVLFDASTQECASQPVTLYFAKNGVLTTTISPACRGPMGWLAGVGLINASHWVLTGSTLGITPLRGEVKMYDIELIDKQLVLRWQGADSSFVGLKGELVTYSLLLKRF